MIDLDLLRTALRLDPDNELEDDLLEQYEAAAVAYVEKATGRYFGPPAERVEILDATGADTLWLQEAPITEPASIYEAEPVIAERSGGAWTDLDVTETPYEFAGRELYREGGWARGRRSVRVTYWAGYAPGAEPADIRQAVMELVAKMYQFRSPVVTDAVSAELPHGVAETIARWRRMVV